MTDFDYKKYSLENLENWMHDAISSAEATPQEIYDVIKGVVEEQYHYFKYNTQHCYELLALLNGNGKGHIQAYDDYVKEVLSEREYYEGKDDGMRSWGHSDIEYGIANHKKPLTCDKDDSSPKCQGAWNDFWEQSYLSGVTDTPEEAEELRKEIKKVREEGGYDWTPKQDRVVRWQLPVQQVIEEGVDNYFVQFPDDLLEAANLKEGDQVEWVDRGDGSYLLRKV
jgi:hypothetical protein